MAQAQLETLARITADRIDAPATILLRGPVGAGKTTFARAFIGARLDLPEDIPSPTFTLVQTYDTSRGAIWHVDLYRLTSIDELEELGLSEAFVHDICLIEWPELIEEAVGDTALDICLEPSKDGASRKVSARFVSDQWAWLEEVEHAGS